MDKLPVNVKKLMKRISKAENGKLTISDLNADDQDRLNTLWDHGLLSHEDYEVTICGNITLPNHPLSVSLSTAGKDYLADRSAERKKKRKEFIRDVVMLILSAVISLLTSWLFNKFSL